MSDQQPLQAPMTPEESAAQRKPLHDLFKPKTIEVGG
jgi:hypothetical protein